MAQLEIVLILLLAIGCDGSTPNWRDVCNFTQKVCGYHGGNDGPVGDIVNFLTSSSELVGNGWRVLVNPLNEAITGNNAWVQQTALNMSGVALNDTLAIQFTSDVIVPFSDITIESYYSDVRYKIELTKKTGYECTRFEFRGDRVRLRDAEFLCENTLYPNTGEAVSILDPKTDPYTINVPQSATVWFSGSSARYSRLSNNAYGVYLFQRSEWGAIDVSGVTIEDSYDFCGGCMYFRTNTSYEAYLNPRPSSGDNRTEICPTGGNGTQPMCLPRFSETGDGTSCLACMLMNIQFYRVILFNYMTANASMAVTMDLPAVYYNNTKRSRADSVLGNLDYGSLLADTAKHTSGIGRKLLNSLKSAGSHSDTLLYVGAAIAGLIVLLIVVLCIHDRRFRKSKLA